MRRFTQMGRRLWLVCGLGLGAALCCAAEPASQPAQPAAPANAPAAVGGAQPQIVIRGGGLIVAPAVGLNGGGDLKNLEHLKATTSAQREIATFKNVDELLHATIENGNLKVDMQSLRTIDGEGRLKVEAGGAGAANATWTIRVDNMGQIAGSLNRIFTIERYDWDQTAEGQYWNVELQQTFETRFQIIAKGIQNRVMYMQFLSQQINVPVGLVHLQVWLPAKKGGGGMQLAVNEAATSLAVLKETHPDEVRQYLQPLLKRLIGKDLLGPGPAEFYSVFSDIPADANVTQAVKDLLPQLDADAFEKRQAGSAELAKLGRPGVLAVLRLDLTPLSEEQKARCRAFVNAYRQGGADDPQQMRRDPQFLLDALEDDDAAVRAAAKNQLQNVLGHEITFDVSAAEELRFKAMGQVRKDVASELAAKAPATQPAEADHVAAPDGAPAGANQPARSGPSIIQN